MVLIVKIIIYLLGRQLSTNPGICLFKVQFNFDSGNYTVFANDADEFNVFEGGNRYGYIMNAYFNLTWILTKMDSLKNKDGKVPLFDLLTCLCDGWNEATGNFNKLAPVVDSETNEIKIVDEVVLPNRNEFLKGLDKSTKLAKFDVQGYYLN